ncbi:trypsin-like peptidase domain-containing protein [Candidatus Electronema sp. PJ]|uniref:trypsin-like peptidase domain-containing protein n=1 Tax=Candidatus Electronema sp. PJ TaxID=3401572 RepID=UPI003AA94C72
MKLHTALAAFMLLCAASLHAHQIHLKDGKTIESDNVWKEGNTVLYEKYGGTISIPDSQVQEIVYVKDPTAAESVPAGSDLFAQLRDKLNPKNPVEEASLRTLAVKTVTGFGSGFLLSSDGYIVTNKHVVRGSEEDFKEIGEQFDQANQQIGKRERELEQWRKSNEQQRQDLKRHQKLLREIERSGQGNAPQIALRKREMAEFESYLQKEEKRYSQAQQEYSRVKEGVDRKAEQFRDGQRLQGQQESFEVILADETKLYATLSKISENHDLALLKLKGYRTPRLEPGSRSELALGQRVFALGSPVDLSLKNTVTSGVLSGFRENFIQTNAQIYPGNSGGPLINEQGQVIGVNTMKLLTRDFEGLGFAIPIETVLAEFGDYLEQVQ